MWWIVEASAQALQGKRTSTAQREKKLPASGNGFPTSFSLDRALFDDGAPREGD